MKKPSAKLCSLFVANRSEYEKLEEIQLSFHFKQEEVSTLSLSRLSLFSISDISLRILIQLKVSSLHKWKG
jgi:hypothetical protein